MTDPIQDTTGPQAVRTACGLWVQRDVDPYRWGNFTWITPIVTAPDDPQDIAALALIQADLMDQVGVDRNPDHDGWAMAAAVAFANLHPCQAERDTTYPDLEWADAEVPEAHLDFADEQPPADWTICGVLRDTWRAASFLVTAGTALAAYFTAWDRCRREFDENLLLAAIHPGKVPVTATFSYADPWARTAADMAATARGWGVR